MDCFGNVRCGEIVYCLLKEKFITREQLDHVLRIRSKLASPKTVLAVLKSLGYVSDSQIKSALRKNKLSLKVGDLLVELEYLSLEQLGTALAIQKQQPGKKLGEILIENHFLSETDFLELLSVQMGFVHLEPDLAGLANGLADNLPLNFCRKHRFVPVKKEGAKTVVVFADPLNKEDVKWAEGVFDSEIVIGVAAPRSIVAALDRLEQGAGQGRQIPRSSDRAIVDGIIRAAIAEDVSDIHLEPLKDRLQIRFRNNGILFHYKNYPLAMGPMLTNRLKMMANADINEKQHHQEGRISFDHDGSTVGLRVSFYVTIHGEKIVLRVHRPMSRLVEVEQLGMAPGALKRFLGEALDVSGGVLIATGPKGAGKTTTVYSCINHLNSSGTSIITAEDPVAYPMDHVAQCAVNPAINMTYRETLRHVAGQDPDAIVIDEVRDQDSAGAAVQAALTGSRVITSFCAEDCVNGLIRLRGMDMEDFLISSTVGCVLSQRLLGRVCDHCAKPAGPTAEELQVLGYTPADVASFGFRRGEGCVHCRHTGYKGMIAVFELLILNEQVREAMVNRCSSHEIRKICIETSGFVTLFEDAVFKAARGITTLEEVFRCVPRQLSPRSLEEINRLQEG